MRADTSGSSGPPQPASSPYRRPGFVLSAAFLALIVVFAVVVAIGGDEDDIRPTTPGRTPQQAPPQASATANGCQVSDRNQQIPQSAPPTTWTLFKSVALPSSPTAGPGVLDGQMARCYARTPTGALMAAVQIHFRSYLADEWRRITLEQITPGPGREIYLRERAKKSGDLSRPGLYGQMAGFKFVTYTPDLAVIQMVARFGHIGEQGAYQVGTTTMVWSAGDWRMQLQADGRRSPSVQQVPDLGGFVPWAGV